MSELIAEVSEMSESDTHAPDLPDLIDDRSDLGELSDNPDRDIADVVAQYHAVKDGGTRMQDGVRRSTRARRQPEIYRDPDADKLLLSGDEYVCSDAYSDGETLETSDEDYEVSGEEWSDEEM